MAFFPQDIDKETGSTRLGSSIHLADQCRKMEGYGLRLGQAKTAGKIPVVHPFGQGYATLARHIFADLVLASLKQALRVLAFDVELKCLFQCSL